jgi:hypothetical protein
MVVCENEPRKNGKKRHITTCASVRKIALNLLKKDTGKESVSSKRLKIA